MVKKMEGALSVLLVIGLISFIQYNHLSETYCRSYETTVSYQIAGSKADLCPLDQSPLDERRVHYHSKSEEQFINPEFTFQQTQRHDLLFFVAKPIID